MKCDRGAEHDSILEFTFPNHHINQHGDDSDGDHSEDDHQAAWSIRF